MKIALINENSQNSKNPMIEAALKKVVEPMGHTVFNYGMYADADPSPSPMCRTASWPPCCSTPALPTTS